MMISKSKTNKGKQNKNRFRTTRKNGGGRGRRVVITRCKPGLKSINDTTCFTKDIIYNIKHHYNINAVKKINTKNPKLILEHIKKNTKCNDEKCWMKTLPPHVRDNITNYLYRPSYPTEWNNNKNEWLSNFDILAVIQQYESSYKQFKFIGPTFVDFDTRLYKDKCVENELCTFDIDSYMKTKQTKIGIIFNLDKHNQRGSHWVSLFIDLESKLIYYFNSTGEAPPPQINALIKRIIAQSIEHGITMDYKYNYLEHQLEDTECGMYSLFFIISMVTDTVGGDMNQPFKHNNDKIAFFTETRITDNDMENLRDKYYVK